MRTSTLPAARWTCQRRRGRLCAVVAPSTALDPQRANLAPLLGHLPASDRNVWCGPGWDALLLDLDRELSKLDPLYEIVQVKEKFGGLRFYSVIESNPTAATAIRRAVARAATTCERCGTVGHLVKAAMWRTLCVEHAVDHLADYGY